MEGADVKKMQIVLDEEKIRREGAYDPASLQTAVDDLLVGRYALVKTTGKTGSSAS